MFSDKTLLKLSFGQAGAALVIAWPENAARTRATQVLVPSVKSIGVHIVTYHSDTTATAKSYRAAQ